MRILCDVDLVIAPADKPWLRWLNEVSGRRKSFKDADFQTVEYDLSYYFPGFKEEFGVAPHAFWDQPYLYDTMGVIDNADRVLNTLVGMGHNLTIASHTKGGHFSSKYRYVKKHLKDVDFGVGSGNGFFATKEKYLLPCDVAIDDRAENLVLFPDHVLKIHFGTIYKDDKLEELRTKPNVWELRSDTPWLDIYEELD